MNISIADYVFAHKLWSEKNFGTGKRTEGLCKHIESELAEIRENPTDLKEWVDVIILAIDGAWRAGYTEYQIEDELIRKQEENFDRKWPKSVSEDEPIEHIKKEE